MRSLVHAACFILVLMGNAYSADLLVPGEYPTIQAAIDTALDGDSIIVDPGTYEENLVFLGKEIHVRSTQGAETTIIDGMQAGAVVAFLDSEPENTILEGFTLTNGTGYSAKSSTYGGGVYLSERSHPLLKSLIIRDNTAKYGAAAYGTTSFATFEKCTVSNNYTDTWGAGIYCDNGSDMKLLYCLIADNEAENRGGAVTSIASAPMINNCILCRNVASRGAGIYTVASDKVPIIVNSNIVMNDATQLASGLYNDSDTIVVNSIFWNFPGGASGEIYVHTGSNPDITYSVVKGGWSGVGNIDADPQFLFAYNHDYHILATSPCIDAGDRNSPYLLDKDIDGDPRITNDTIDIGADEFSTPHGTPGEYYVPDDYVNIQDAIDASFPGDVVVVRPGTYFENLNFKGRPITIKSSEGSAQTFIDGQGGFTENRPVVKFMFMEQHDSVLQGFTLTNGSGYKESVEQSSKGGGVYSSLSNPTFIDVVFEHNKADNGGGLFAYGLGGYTIKNCVFRANESLIGGGIYLHGSAIVENCTIEKNLFGGGIYASTSGTVIIRNNTIQNNQNGSGIECIGQGEIRIENNDILNNVREGDHGAGIFISGNNGLNTIRNNRIIGNAAVHGGGIHSVCKGITVSDNIIACNIAEGQGGGIKCAQGGKFLNNVICYNQANATPAGKHGLGGGIMSVQSDGMTIANCLIYKNSAARYGGGLYLYEGIVMNLNHLTIVNNTAEEDGSAIYASGQAFMTISNSILRNGGGSEIYSEITYPEVVYSNIQGGWLKGSNIDVDPLFVNETGNDFHLRYDSPCLNAGSNDYVTTTEDFEGDPRIAYDIADMGADEFHPHLYCTGDFSPNGSIEVKLVGVPDTNPVGLFIGSGVRESPMSHYKWGDFWLEEPWVLFPLVPIPANGVLTIPATIPGTPAPYDIPMQALIDWEFSNLFVLNVR